MSNNPDDFDQVSPPPDDGAGTNATADAGSQLSKAEAEAAEFKDAWLRAKAETDNVRKQGQNDVAKAYKYAIERFAQELLTVKDALEVTLATPNATTEALKDGVELTLKNLNAAFERERIVEIDPAGEK